MLLVGNMLPQEFERPHNEVNYMADILAKTFIQRWDLYAKQLNDGRYICIHKPLEQRHLISHLLGKITLGTYLFDSQNKSKFIVFDADEENQLKALITMSQDLAQQTIPSYLEVSRRGGHLWLFFDKPVSGKQARQFGKGLMVAYNLANIELFPKQDRLKTGPGSLIRLPFGIHRKDGNRYGFLLPNGEPLVASAIDQIHAFSAPQDVPRSFFHASRTSTLDRTNNTIKTRSGEVEETLADKIKASISVYDFVSQYIGLSPTGQGLCPFHEDHHASLSVNIEENYWHCFAGCGGGSVIDFWIRLKGCDFKVAIQELSKTLTESY